MSKHPEPLPPPTSAPDEQPLVCIRLNVHWIPYLLRAVQPLRYPEFWSGTYEENLEARGNVRNLIALLMSAEDCNNMTCCDGSDLLIVVQTRVSVTGEISISIDGGNTWHNSPHDPRMMVPEVPPITATPGRTKCDAATNALEKLQDVQAGISNNLNTVATINDFLITCLEVVLAALLIVLGAGALLELVPILGAYFRALYGHTQSEYDALFTSSVWDAVTCILYCNASDDGTFTPESFATVLAKCMTDIPGGTADFSAAASIQAMLKVWGVQGLNYAASTGTAALSDCSACDCVGCDYSGWTVSVGSLIGQTSTSISGNAVSGGDGNYYLNFRSPSLSACCCHIDLELLSGSQPTVIGYCPCGLDYNNVNNFGYAYTGQSANLMAFKGPAPFSLRIFSSEPCA